jgi:hypothetical protein
MDACYGLFFCNLFWFKQTVIRLFLSSDRIIEGII